MENMISLLFLRLILGWSQNIKEIYLFGPGALSRPVGYLMQERSLVDNTDISSLLFLSE